MEALADGFETENAAEKTAWHSFRSGLEDKAGEESFDYSQLSQANGFNFGGFSGFGGFA